MNKRQSVTKKLEQSENQTEFLQFKCTPTLKSNIQKLADKERRKVSDFIRVTMEDLVAKDLKS